MTDKLDVKIGTPEEATWTSIKKNTETRISECEIALELDKEMLKYINKRLEKFK